jgi:4-O-beta-D-mannosyl-D-glucose phosphorylase
MNQLDFRRSVQKLFSDQEKLLARRNRKAADSNGIVDRYRFPVLTATHAPIAWRYDLNRKTNPLLLERIAVNAAFNAGAILHEGKYLVVARVEGADRKSFFAVAESSNGVDNFRFWDYPISMPETSDPDTNVYDMRLVRHQDGWIYGLFCTERKDPKTPAWDTSSAVAQCGIARTRDLKVWERLADLQSKSPQQRNVVLHPEFIDAQYAFYTRPQDDFIQAGKGGGIGWGLSPSIENAVAANEIIVDNREYHTIQEVKNGLGPAPIKTADGCIWPTACAIRPPVCATCSMCFSPIFTGPGSSPTSPPDISWRLKAMSAWETCRTCSSATDGSRRRMARCLSITHPLTRACMWPQPPWRGFLTTCCTHRQIL